MLTPFNTIRQHSSVTRFPESLVFPPPGNEVASVIEVVVALVASWRDYYGLSARTTCGSCREVAVSGGSTPHSLSGAYQHQWN